MCCCTHVSSQFSVEGFCCLPKGVTVRDITRLQCLGSPPFIDFVSSNLNIVIRKQSIENKRWVGSGPQIVDEYQQLITVFILEKTCKIVKYGQNIYRLQSVTRTRSKKSVMNEVIGRFLPFIAGLRDESIYIHVWVLNIEYNRWAKFFSPNIIDTVVVRTQESISRYKGFDIVPICEPNFWSFVLRLTVVMADVSQALSLSKKYDMYITIMILPLY